MKSVLVVLFLLPLLNPFNNNAWAEEAPTQTYSASGRTVTVECLGCTVEIQNPPYMISLPRLYFAVGASGVYLVGTTLGDFGSGAGEFNLDIAVPFGSLRWLQFLAQASFGGGDGMFSGSSSVGLGFVLNGDPDERAGGSTRLGLLASLRGIGDGDSQDLLDIGGKLEFEVSMGRVMSTQWNWFLGVEGGGSIYTDENDVNQNDGWYLTTVTGFTIRL